jgi:hypothetical protein
MFKTLCYSVAKHLKMRTTSGIPPRQPVEFFTSIASSMDRVSGSGNTLGSTCCEFSNALSTFALENAIVGFQISTRSNHA